jgi:hypothetical protein
MLFNDSYNMPDKCKVKFFFLIIFLTSFTGLYGQRIGREAPPLKERLFYGGSFNLQFGTFTDIEVSPIIGLWVLPRINFATGPNFRFYKVYSSKTTIYGGRVYSEFLFLQDLNNVLPLGVHLGLFSHIEYELLSLESAFFKTTYDSKRFLTNTILAGGGIRQQIGERSSLNLTFLWALNESEYEIYGNPEIRVSFIF